MSNFKDLKVWQKAHEFALEIYRVTATFPSSEMYGLVSQMRRCSVSVGANIAEGRGRDGDVEFSRFIRIACGSLNELEYHLLLARDLGYLSSEQHESLNSQLAEVNRMLLSLRSRVRAARA